MMGTSEHLALAEIALLMMGKSEHLALILAIIKNLAATGILTT